MLTFWTSSSWLFVTLFSGTSSSHFCHRSERRRWWWGYLGTVGCGPDTWEMEAGVTEQTFASTVPHLCQTANFSSWWTTWSPLHPSIFLSSLQSRDHVPPGPVCFSNMASTPSSLRPFWLLLLLLIGQFLWSAAKNQHLTDQHRISGPIHSEGVVFLPQVKSYSLEPQCLWSYERIINAAPSGYKELADPSVLVMSKKPALKLMKHGNSLLEIKVNGVIYKKLLLKQFW